RMFCAISPAAAPVVRAGSIESILSHWPQVRVPPLTGVSDFAAPLAGGTDVAGVQLRIATLAAASAERRRNSRRYSIIRSAIDRSLQDVQPFLELRVGDRERDERADDVAVETGAQEQEAALTGATDRGVHELLRGLLRLPILHELDGLHRADTARLADDRFRFDERVEAGPDARADLCRALGDAVALHHLDRRDGRGAGDGVAAGGRPERSRRHRVEQLGAAGDGADRKTVAKRLGGDQQVWRDAGVLYREHAAGAAHARLDLVGDEEDVVAPADRRDAPQESLRRNDEAALALNRLEDHRGDVLRGEMRVERLLEEPHVQLGELLLPDRRERTVGIRIWEVRDVRRGRAHERHARVLRLARRGHRRVRTPVERVLEGDDPLASGRDARDLHRVLDRLGAAVGEDALRRDRRALRAWEDAIELLGEAHVGLVRH